MDARCLHRAFGRQSAWRSLALAGCAVTLVGGAQARADVQQTGGSQTPPSSAGSGQQGVSATLEQCQTAIVQTERSATFAGEMTSIVGTERMQMRIDVQELMPDETRFHTIHAPGLGVWRGSSPEVKAYKYLRQVTNLSAPAFYRAAVSFRWLNADGRLIKAEERHTPACYQSAPPSEPTAEAPQTSGGGSASGSAGSRSATAG
jgi:hypothetical protein